MEVMELFNSLESNLPHEVEEVKHKFHEQFNNSKHLNLIQIFLISILKSKLFH